MSDPAPALPEGTTALAELLDRADGHALASLAPTTVTGYSSDWRSFTRFCAVHDLTPVPAAPTTVALYLEDLLTRARRATLDRHLAAIVKAHRLAGHPSPLQDPWLESVVRGIRRSTPLRSAGKDALLLHELRAMVLALPDSPLGARDRALLLLGYQGALRRSELVALDVEHLEFRDVGVLVEVARSKTDQLGHGEVLAIPNGRHPATCAPSALQHWLTVAGIDHGPLFRPLSRGGRVLPRRLGAATVGTVVQQRARAAGIEDPSRLGAHSLRAGFVTEATRHAPEHQVARQTRHRRVETLWRYVRNRDLFTDSPAGRLDL